MLRIVLVFGFAVFAAGSHENDYRYAAENAYRRGLYRNADAAESYQTYRYDDEYESPYGDYNLNSAYGAAVNPADPTPHNNNGKSPHNSNDIIPNHNNNIIPNNNHHNVIPDNNNHVKPNPGNSDSGANSPNRMVDLLFYNFQRAPKPIILMSPNIDPKKETYFIVHGVSDGADQTIYVKDYFSRLSQAIHYYCDYKCNVIGLQWAPVYDNNDFINMTKIAIEAGHLFSKVISKIPKSKRLTLIGHDLGNVVISSISPNSKLDAYVYGIEQRILPRGFEHCYLRKEMFELMQTVNMDSIDDGDFFEYDYGHRNFHFKISHWNETKAAHHSHHSLHYALRAEGVSDYCYKCYSYRLFADDIMKKGLGHPASFCIDFDSYIKGVCNKFPLASFFNTRTSVDMPHGRYFSWEGVL